MESLLLVTVLAFAAGLPQEEAETDCPEVEPPVWGWFGYTIEPFGDWNEDGACDFLVGAPREQAPDSVGRWEPRPTVRAISGKDGQVLFACAGRGEFGTSIAVLGDTNGDGKPDFAVGSTSAGVTLCSGADGSSIRRFVSPHASIPEDPYGGLVAAPGDVNGDGVPDVAICWQPSAGSRGIVRVYSVASGEVLYSLEDDRAIVWRVYGLPDLNGDGVGELAYLRATGERQYPDPTEIKVASGKDGTAIFTIAPPDTEYALLVVADAGDVNGDGTSDLLLGASAFEDWERRGKVYVFSGDDGSELRQLNEPSSSGMYGHAVAGGKDFDRDGVPDFLVTEYDDFDREVWPGRSWLYSGRDGSAIQEQAGLGLEEFGATATCIDDLDGDGIPDYLIGCMNDYVGSGDWPGFVRAYSGKTGALLYRVPRTQ